MRFSIVTATYNRKNLLIDAIESVAVQNFDDLEHIVVDGGSNDGTLEALKAYPGLKIISEPDEGVYDAMNKGIRAAMGDVIILLNSDDLLPPGTLDFAAKQFEDSPNLDALYGAVEIQDMQDNVLAKYDAPHLLDLSKAGDTSYPILTNARFIKRDLLMQIGTFDISFPRLSDNDLFIKLKHTDHKFQTTQCVLYCYRSHEGSLTIRGNFADASIWQEYLALGYKGMQQTSEASPIYEEYKKLYIWSAFRCWRFHVFNFGALMDKFKTIKNAYTILMKLLITKTIRKVLPA